MEGFNPGSKPRSNNGLVLSKPSRSANTVDPMLTRTSPIRNQTLNPQHVHIRGFKSWWILMDSSPFFYWIFSSKGRGWPGKDLSFYLWKSLPEWVSETGLLIRNLELELRKKQPTRTRGKQTLTGLREKQLGLLTADRPGTQYTQFLAQKRWDFR